MAATFIAGSQSGNAASTTLTLTKPAGTTHGDILIAAVYLRPPTASPTGWIQIGQSADGERRIYIKRAGSAEPVDYTWTQADAFAVSGAMGCWRGLASGNPGSTIVDDITTVETPPVTTTIVLPAALAREHDLVVAIGVINTSTDPSRTATTPAGYTKRVEAIGTGYFATIAIYDAIVAPGTPNPDDVTVSQSGGRSNGWTISLRQMRRAVVA